MMIFIDRPSKPGPHAEDEAHIVRTLAIALGKTGGLAELLLENDADIRRKFAGDFIAQAQARIDVGETRSDIARPIGSAVEVKLDLRLQDQPLRDEKVIGAFEA